MNPPANKHAQALLQISAAAVQSEMDTGIPGLLSAAQCILESGWLAHAPRNNCFGIKLYAGAFGRQLLRTIEYFTPAERYRFLILGDGREAEPMAGAPDAHGRSPYKVRDWFATFANLSECFSRHAELLKRNRYAPAWNQFQQDRNGEAFARAIAPIYATDPKYAEKVLGLMRDSDLVAAVDARRAEIRVQS